MGWKHNNVSILLSHTTRMYDRAHNARKKEGKGRKGRADGDESRTAFCGEEGTSSTGALAAVAAASGAPGGGPGGNGGGSSAMGRGWRGLTIFVFSLTRIVGR